MLIEQGPIKLVNYLTVSNIYYDYLQTYSASFLLDSSFTILKRNCTNKIRIYNRTVLFKSSYRPLLQLCNHSTAKDYRAPSTR